jgi:fermentation-respiration switch protein FrsA (DUF1100 family)
VALVLGAERQDVVAVVTDSPFADGASAISDGIRYEAGLPPWPAAAIVRAVGFALTGHDPGALDVLAAERVYGARPLLLIQSGIEDRFGVAQGRRLESAAGSGASLWWVADAGHNRAWIVQRTEYERRVRAFLLPHLSPPAAAAPSPVSGARRRALHRPEEVPA